MAYLRSSASLASTSLALGVVTSLVTSSASVAYAQPTGAPPADSTALVAAPKDPTASAPAVFKANDSTNVTLAAGGQLATGNSQLLAGTVNGKYEMRRGQDGFGASLLGNYGQGAATPGAEQHVTAENLQGRIRYDRYLSDRVSIFLIDTERHDRFQGLEIRTNVDPGVKYLFVHEDTTTLWGELGYDFQYDVRLGSALIPTDPTTGAYIAGPLLPKTATEQSGRLFVGFKHAFNSKVTFTTGLEYLQAFASSTPGSAGDYRLNYDALFAANVAGGFSLGVGFSARYDHLPLPGKEQTDTATTLSLIYSFSEPAPAAAPTCPCPPPPAPPDAAPPPPPPPPSAPDAATPISSAPTTPTTTPGSTMPATPAAPATPTGTPGTTPAAPH
jgi:putative salt-induced outer membrane protein YdiY